MRINGLLQLNIPNNRGLYQKGNKRNEVMPTQSFTSLLPYQADYAAFNNNIELNPQTSLFRNDISWDFLANTIKQKFPEGAKIHCFACSDGSEPYSLALRMMTKLGKQDSKKYFPIQAYDINKRLIEKNKEGKIQLFDKHSFFSDQDFSKNDEFKYFKRDHKFKSQIVKYSKDIPYLVSVSMYKVKSKLRDKVNFKVGDICDFSEIPQKSPTVVLFRNAWYLLKDNEIENNLIKNLSKNLPQGSILVIGKTEEESYKDQKLQKKLYDNGFSLIDKNHKNIFIKRADEDIELVQQEYDEELFIPTPASNLLEDLEY